MPKISTNIKLKLTQREVKYLRSVVLTHVKDKISKGSPVDTLLPTQGSPRSKRGLSEIYEAMDWYGICIRAQHNGLHGIAMSHEDRARVVVASSMVAPYSQRTEAYHSSIMFLSEHSHMGDLYIALAGLKLSERHVADCRNLLVIARCFPGIHQKFFDIVHDRLLWMEANNSIAFNLSMILHENYRPDMVLNAIPDLRAHEKNIRDKWAEAKAAKQVDLHRIAYEWYQDPALAAVFSTYCTPPKGESECPLYRLPTEVFSSIVEMLDLESIKELMLMSYAMQGIVANLPAWLYHGARIMGLAPQELESFHGNMWSVVSELERVCYSLRSASICDPNCFNLLKTSWINTYAQEEFTMPGASVVEKALGGLLNGLLSILANDWSAITQFIVSESQLHFTLLRFARDFPSLTAECLGVLNWIVCSSAKDAPLWSQQFVEAGATLLLASLDDGSAQELTFLLIGYLRSYQFMDFPTIKRDLALNLYNHNLARSPSLFTTTKENFISYVGKTKREGEEDSQLENEKHKILQEEFDGAWRMSWIAVQEWPDTNFPSYAFVDLKVHLQERKTKKKGKKGKKEAKKRKQARKNKDKSKKSAATSSSISTHSSPEDPDEDEEDREGEEEDEFVDPTIADMKGRAGAVLLKGKARAMGRSGLISTHQLKAVFLFDHIFIQVLNPTASPDTPGFRDIANHYFMFEGPISPLGFGGTFTVMRKDISFLSEVRRPIGAFFMWKEKHHRNPLYTFSQVAEAELFELSTMRTELEIKHCEMKPNQATLWDSKEENDADSFIWFNNVTTLATQRSLSELKRIQEKFSDLFGRFPKDGSWKPTTLIHQGEYETDSLFSFRSFLFQKSMSAYLLFIRHSLANNITDTYLEDLLAALSGLDVQYTYIGEALDNNNEEADVLRDAMAIFAGRESVDSEFMRERSHWATEAFSKIFKYRGTKLVEGNADVNFLKTLYAVRGILLTQMIDSIYAHERNPLEFSRAVTVLNSIATDDNAVIQAHEQRLAEGNVPPTSVGQRVKADFVRKQARSKSSKVLRKWITRWAATMPSISPSSIPFSLDFVALMLIETILKFCDSKYDYSIDPVMDHTIYGSITGRVEKEEEEETGQEEEDENLRFPDPLFEQTFIIPASEQEYGVVVEHTDEGGERRQTIAYDMQKLQEVLPDVQFTDDGGEPIKDPEELGEEENVLDWAEHDVLQFEEEEQAALAANSQSSQGIGAIGDGALAQILIRGVDGYGWSIVGWDVMEKVAKAYLGAALLGIPDFSKR